MCDPEELLEFWFGTKVDEAKVIAEKTDLWWSKDPAHDRLCRERFAEALAAARGDELVDWPDSARGRLALIILLDQISRVLYRDSAKAFADDDRARSLTAGGIVRRLDTGLRYCERVFFYMPLMHSEDLEEQERSVELYRGLLAAGPSSLEEQLSENLDHAIEHRDVIQRFGRFPHRNAVLGRESTEEELVYLADRGARF
jgi:uncharacterized protein (DUF924 family)